MIKRVVMATIALAAVLVIGNHGLALPSNEGSWTGQINDSMCGAKNIDAACATKCVNDHGGKYVFINDKDNKIFSVEPQDKVAAHAGHHVILKGTIEGDTITVASVTMPPAKK